MTNQPTLSPTRSPFSDNDITAAIMAMVAGFIITMISISFCWFLRHSRSVAISHKMLYQYYKNQTNNLNIKYNGGS